MQGDGEKEEADYQAECQAQAEAEGQAEHKSQITFEEQFPSLKDKIVCYDYDGNSIPESTIKQNDVFKFCLDKQKVLEIIDKIVDPKQYSSAIVHLLNAKLKKELWLE